jgi:pyrophosphatase PpaX
VTGILPCPSRAALFAALARHSYNRARFSSMQKTPTQHPYEAVIFDLDGTLADTFPTVMRSYNQVMLDYTGRTWTLEEMLPHFGPPEDVIFKKFIQDGSRHEAALEDYYRLIEADGVEIKPFAGMRELLAELRAAGNKLAVFTGATTRAGRIRLRHACLLEFFDEVLGSDGLSNYKPHPEGLWRLLKQFKVAPQAAIFIGDSPLDMLAGRDAGVTTAAVLWGAGTRESLEAAGPDFLLEQPTQLRTVFS